MPRRAKLDTSRAKLIEDMLRTNPSITHQEANRKLVEAGAKVVTPSYFRKVRKKLRATTAERRRQRVVQVGEQVVNTARQVNNLQLDQVMNAVQQVNGELKADLTPHNGVSALDLFNLRDFCRKQGWTLARLKAVITRTEELQF